MLSRYILVKRNGAPVSQITFNGDTSWADGALNAKVASDPQLSWEEFPSKDAAGFADAVITNPEVIYLSH